MSWRHVWVVGWVWVKESGRRERERATHMSLGVSSLSVRNTIALLSHTTCISTPTATGPITVYRAFTSYSGDLLSTRGLPETYASRYLPKSNCVARFRNRRGKAQLWTFRSGRWQRPESFRTSRYLFPCRPTLDIFAQKNIT